MEIFNTKGHKVGECSHSGLHLEIGCGFIRPRDSIGIDINPGENVDIVRDLETQGLPFCDKSIENIHAYNVMEHMGEGFHFLMKECWRVLKDGGTLEIGVPDAGTDASFKDPTHRRFFSKNTFVYFTRTRPRHHSYMPDHPWKVTSLKLGGPDDEHPGFLEAVLTPDRDE